MKDNVIYFPSKSDYHDYVEKVAKRKLGEGAEGEAYLINNNETIKEIYCIRETYPNNNILMESDIKLDSFLFPKELYVVGTDIVGYTADYFPNLFRLFDGDLDDINIDMVIKAGYKMIEDIRVLSKMSYILYDLPNNLLFDGKSLKAIDTLMYYKSDKASLDGNIDILRTAIIEALKNHDMYCSIAKQNSITRRLSKEFGGERR